MPDINMQVFEEVKRNQLVSEVDIQTEVVLDDYQVQLLDIANPTQSQDNVVVDRFNEFLPHWNESLDFDTWVKMSMELAGKKLLIIHGNAGLSNRSSISDTFIFGDDYEWTDVVTNHGYTVESGSHATSTNQAKTGNRSLYVGSSGSGGIHTSTDWITNNVILEFDFYDTHAAGATSSVFAGISDGVNYNGVSADDTNANYYRLRYAAASYVTSTVGRSIGWHNVKQIHTTNGDIDTYIDDVFVTTQTNVVPDAYIRFYAFDDWYADNLRTRKYTAIEPICTIGTSKNISIALKSLGRAG